jgi:hypothetical protein
MLILSNFVEELDGPAGVIGVRSRKLSNVRKGQIGWVTKIYNLELLRIFLLLLLSQSEILNLYLGLFLPT